MFEDDFEADDDIGCVSKMYVAESSSGDVELAYLGHIQRDSLISEVRERAEALFCFNFEFSRHCHRTCHKWHRYRTSPRASHE